MATLKYLGVILMLVFSAISTLCQVPSVPELFRKRDEQLRSMKSLKYELQTIHINGGQADSVFTAKSTTWVMMVPEDTIYGAYFHVKQVSDNGMSEYFYDGSMAIDIYHQHRSKELSQTVKMIQPFTMGNGVNSVKTLMTAAMGFVEENTTAGIPAKWRPFVDSMQITDFSDNWLLQWNESYPAENYYATQQVYFDKKTFVITKISRRYTWQNIPSAVIRILANFRVNDTSDLDSVRNYASYPGYKTSTMDRHSFGSKESDKSLTGTKAPEFTYTSFHSKAVKLRPAKGRLMLLDFWETWCGYCFIAMPRIEKLYQAKYSAGLDVVGVVTENKEQVKKIVASDKFSYPTVFADAKVIQAFNLQGRPRYILIDENGMVLYDGSDLREVEEEIDKRLVKLSWLNDLKKTTYPCKMIVRQLISR